MTEKHNDPEGLGWLVVLFVGLAVTVPIWGPYLLVENALHKRRMRRSGHV